MVDLFFNAARHKWVLRLVQTDEEHDLYFDELAAVAALAEELRTAVSDAGSAGASEQ